MTDFNEHIQIVNIAPRDIYVTLELSITGIRMLLRAGGKVVINYDSKEEPDMPEAVGFFKAFFKLLSEAEEQVGPTKREPA